MPVISGVVVDAAGRAVSDARVYVVDGPSPVTDVAALTDGEGRFALSAPADGTYTVECRAELGGASLAATARITVRDTDPGGPATEIRLTD